MTLNVAVRLTGGLGDVLVAVPFLDALYDVLEGPDVTAYYHTPAIASFVFGSSRTVRAFGTHEQFAGGAYKAADLVVHTGHFPRYIEQRPNAHKRMPPAFWPILRESAKRIDRVQGLVTAHPKLDGHWARMMARRGRGYLHGIGYLSALPIDDHTPLRLDLDPAAAVKQVITRGALLTTRYVTVHDGFDNRQAPAAGQATKCWPLERWTAFVQQFRAMFPDVAVIQLGAGKSRPIPGVDLNLVNATSLAETSWLIKGATYHVDTDSGLAHMAKALHTPAAVLFGPTNAEYFGHIGNANIRTPSPCNDCWWSAPTWLAQCPRGLAVPECMDAIDPTAVLHAIAGRISHPPAWSFSSSPVQLYDGKDDRTAQRLREMCEFTGLTPAPISEHIVDPTTGVYIHASKQWEYVYAVDAIEQATALPTQTTTIADVGGGRGALAGYLARRGARVVQFDRDYLWAGRRDREHEEAYRRHARQAGYEARFGSIYNLPAASESFDVVTCISVIEHLPQKPAALRELLRILKPGGICILTFDLAAYPEPFEDRMRVEVTSPERLAAVFADVGVPFPGIDSDVLHRSAERIQADRVLGIPAGLTVAGVVIRKG